MFGNGGKWSALGVVAVLAGCSSSFLVIPKVGLREVTVTASKNANRDHVTLVHFVFPKSEALYQELKKMDAQAYFAVAAQLALDYPNDLEVVAVEVAPGMRVTEKIQLKDFKSRAALVFARYENDIPGLHREELRSLCKKTHISLGRSTFTVTY